MPQLAEFMTCLAQQAIHRDKDDYGETLTTRVT